MTSTQDCVLCSGFAHAVLEKRGIPIYACGSCDHRFALPPDPDLHVSTVYGIQYFEDGGDGYPDYLQEASMLRQRGRRYAKRVARHAPPGSCLDVGCAAGFTLEGFQSEGWSGTGLEPNNEMAHFGNTQLGLNIIEGTLENTRLPDKYDLVVLIQVIAHFVNMRLAMENLRSLVAPGGLVLVETWDRSSLTARIFGKHWHELCPPSVLHWFSRTSLDEMFQQYGFLPVDGGRMVKWISMRHLTTLGLHSLSKRAHQNLINRIPENWKVPYPSEDLFWTLYRLN